MRVYSEHSNKAGRKEYLYSSCLLAMQISCSRNTLDKLSSRQFVPTLSGKVLLSCQTALHWFTTQRIMVIVLLTL